jgi:hypothetical protein
LKTQFPQKLSDVSFTNPTSRVGLHLLKLWLLKVILKCINNGVMTIKPGHQTTGNACVIWSDDSFFPLFPTSGRVCVWRTSKEHKIRKAWFGPKVKRGEDSVIV